MHKNMYKKNPSLIIFLLLIASLPLTFVRYDVINGSIPLAFMIGIGIYSFIKIALSGKSADMFQSFEWMIAGYIILVFCIYLFHLNESAIMPMIKTVTYFILYLLLRSYLAMFKPDEIMRCIFHGVFLGTVFFLVFLIILYADNTLFKFEDEVLSYGGWSFRLYESINFFYGGTEDFKSRDMMRSPVGEAFSFYSIFLVLFFLKNRELLVLWLLPVAIFLLLLAFSRRSLVSLMVSLVFIFTFFKADIRLRILFNLFIFILVFSSFFFLFNESRFMDLSLDSTRENMFELALYSIDQNLLLGVGYGEKIFDDLYVHNFMLSSGVSLGLVGLVISSFIFATTIYIFFKGIFVRNYSSFLTSIPVLGMLVGSSTESIFTLTSWIIFALYFDGDRRARSSRTNLDTKIVL